MRTLALLSALIATLGLTACEAELVNNPAVAYSYLVAGDPQIVSHWVMNELEGTVAADTLGRNNGIYQFGTSTPGMTLGAPGPLFGWTNYSVRFHPPSAGQSTTNSGAIVIPYSDTMRLTDSLSIEAWMKVDPSADQVDWAKIMWMGTNGSYCTGQGPWGYELYGSSSNLLFHVAADTNGNGNARDIKATIQTTIVDGNWHHVVGVFDSTGQTDNDVIRVYVDGVRSPLVFDEYFQSAPSAAIPPGSLVGSKIPASAYLLHSGSPPSCVPSETTPSRGLTIANAWGANQHFIGDFASMAFYKGPLTDTQVLNHYNQGKYGKH